MPLELVAQRCHTNACPTGVTTQDAHRARAVHAGKISVGSPAARRHLAFVMENMAWTGADSPDGLRSAMLRRRSHLSGVCSYDELYDWLGPGELLDDPPPS
jgi:glutamate synthase domain-containing protein 2